MAKAYALNEAEYSAFQKMRRWIRNFRVTGAKNFQNTEDSCSIVIGAAAESTTRTAAVKLIPVKLTQSGGSNGNATTASTYTYDLATFTTKKDGTKTVLQTIGTAQSPMVARPLGAVTSATEGLAIPATDGGYALFIAFEKPGSGVCS